MFVQELHIEMTRNCTLYCEHCLRGEKECINIGKNTIDNIFKDVTSVSNLLLTGGEPLIAVQELEYLIDVLRTREINVGYIQIITNGTIMSARVLRILKELKSLARLNIVVSSDIFHLLELERLGLKDLRDKNLQILKELFDAIEYGSDYKKTSEVELSYCGRAETLTKERLAEINKQSNFEFTITDGVRTMIQPTTYFSGGYVIGYIPVDVNGNIVSYGQSFKEEDIEAEKNGININELGFRGAVRKFTDYLDKVDVIAARFTL